MQLKCRGSYSKAWRANEGPEAREAIHPRWPISRTVPLFLWFFSWNLQHFLICLGEAYHNTFLSGDKCKTGCNIAFQAFAKGKDFAAESKLPDPCPATDPGMLCAGTTGHWSCCFCRLAGCKGHKTPKYPSPCSGSYVSLVSTPL